MDSYFKNIIFLIAIAAVTGCRKPYNPPASSTPNSYLVVEGIINSGSDSTVIKLSKTVNISSKVTLNPLSQAVVTVESDQNGSYLLTEIRPGSYAFPGLNLNNSRKYRLRIKTADNRQYLSDYVPVLNSPPIDSITYTTPASGLNIFANTHDPNNATRYYRWDYTETWMFHSNYDSQFKSNGDTVLARDLVNDEIYTCWQTDTSSVIVLGSSAKLSKDVIVGSPVTFIKASSEKVSDEYSILLRQYALTSEAYTFWTNLKKNTEQLGSIFDAQPSQINGNIHSVTNPGEPVIGYISVGSTSSMRIFISNRILPAWQTIKFYTNCNVDVGYYAYYPPGKTIPINQENYYFNYNRGATDPDIPINAIGMPGDPQPIGFTGATPACVDCTLRGTNKEPKFWKY